MDDSALDDVVEVINPSGEADILLVCEHASNFIPPELHDLGLNGDAVKSHIAWDPGALGVAKEMSSILGAPLLAQRVSRLVYDCNRPPDAQSAMPAESEIYRIPGNVGLLPAARRARVEQYYAPFRDALAAHLDQRMATGNTPVLVTVHSFTPVFKGVRRDVDIGILHDADSRLADVLLKIMEKETDLAVRRNAPYGPKDGVTHTLIAHALPRGILNVMIEIRHDLIADPASQKRFGALLASWIAAALADLGAGSTGHAGRHTEKAEHA